MLHQDLKVVRRKLQGECLGRALATLLRDVCWKPIRFRDDCTWSPPLLAATALLWAWSDESTLVERFQTVRSIVMFIFSVQQEPAGSYQAFMKMLVRWTGPLVTLLQQSLRCRLPQQYPDLWKVRGFVMFGCDGSRIETPRTRSNEDAFSPASCSRPKTSRRRQRTKSAYKKANVPQIWLTTMWHVGTGLPWDWRWGPSDSSERGHLLEMLNGLPAEALITADAGFVGYEYSRAITDSGRNLLIRVGSNVRLLKKLGYVCEHANTVYLWPDKAASKNAPPLVLRLVVAHSGRHPVYLVTSVRSTRQLSDKEVIELYARRWGIELFYRHLKQTFDRRKLRSTTADHARVELDWSLIGLWAMGFYTLQEAYRLGTSPQKISVAQMLLGFRRTLRDYRHPLNPRRTLRHRLQLAVIDSYVRRNKTSRDYPRKKQESAPGAPIISTATREQTLKANQLRPRVQKRLTA